MCVCVCLFAQLILTKRASETWHKSVKETIYFGNHELQKFPYSWIKQLFPKARTNVRTP